MLNVLSKMSLNVTFIDLKSVFIKEKNLHLCKTNSPLSEYKTNRFYFNKKF